MTTSTPYGTSGSRLFGKCSGAERFVEMNWKPTLLIGCLAIALTTSAPFSSSANASYDIVILHGRVIDPESRLDAIRNIGINGSTIKAISQSSLNGRLVIDARGLTVTPGFIDLHQHGQNDE